MDWLKSEKANKEKVISLITALGLVIIFAILYNKTMESPPELTPGMCKLINGTYPEITNVTCGDAWCYQYSGYVIWEIIVSNKSYTEYREWEETYTLPLGFLKPCYLYDRRFIIFNTSELADRPSSSTALQVILILFISISVFIGVFCTCWISCDMYYHYKLSGADGFGRSSELTAPPISTIPENKATEKTALIV
jgi:hypothetical protein